MGPGPAPKAAHSPGRPRLWARQEIQHDRQRKSPRGCADPRRPQAQSAGPSGRSFGAGRLHDAACGAVTACRCACARRLQRRQPASRRAASPLDGGPACRSPATRRVVDRVSGRHTGRPGATRRQRQHQHPAGRWPPGRGPLAAALGRRCALGAGGRIGRCHPPGRCRHHGQCHPRHAGHGRAQCVL